MVTRKILRKTVMSSLIMIFLLLFVGSSFASELDDVRAAIKEKGAKWIAGETSVSKLPPEHRKLRLGLAKHEITGAERLVSPEPLLLELPETLDWRHHPQSNSYVTPVRDQGNCGSCWAFATTGALESNILIKNNQPNMDLDLAEQILVSCSRAGSCSGGYIDRASNFIRDTGLPGEPCYPYTATNGNCRKACNDWRLNTDWIDSWSYVAHTTDAIKTALNSYGPLVTTMDVYADFFYYKGGIYRYAEGTYQGGHAVLIIGYDDINQYFIVKNSWGTDWGEQGFFNIAYSELNSVVGFGYWTIAYQGAEASCSYSISPTSQSFDAPGGTDSIYVTADTNCSWTAVSNTSWIILTSGSSGTGYGTVEYNVLKNRTKKIRTGTITVAGQQFTVTQSGR